MLNLTVGVALALLFVFLIVQIGANALYPRKNLDNFVKQTIATVEAVPDEIESMEENVHESVDFAKDSAVKAWHHYHQKVEDIEGELNQLVKNKEF